MTRTELLKRCDGTGGFKKADQKPDRASFNGVWIDLQDGKIELCVDVKLKDGVFVKRAIEFFIRTDGTKSAAARKRIGKARDRFGLMSDIATGIEKDFRYSVKNNSGRFRVQLTNSDIDSDTLADRVSGILSRIAKKKLDIQAFLSNI